MKKSVIIDMFYGNRGYREVMKTPPKDLRKLDIICNLEEKLKSELTLEQFNLHKKFVDAIEENCCNEVDFYFAEGFKLGLLMGIETMENE